MQDAEFFDHLFQVFARTTGAEDTYWMSQQEDDLWDIYAVSADDTKTPVAFGFSEVDADFITAIHGCMPDLVRRLHDALDEADRLDTARDEREQEIGRLTLENQELKVEIADRAHTEAALHESVLHLCNERSQLAGELAAARARAADVLWKIERPM